MPTLKIGQRLTLAFALMLVLLSGVATISSGRFNELAKITRSIVEVQVQRAFLAQSANAHAQRAATCLLLLLQTNERERRITLYGEMDSELAASDAAIASIAEIEKNLQATGDATPLTGLIQLRDNYDDRFRETVEMIEIDGTAKARAHFDAHTQKALDALLSETQRLSVAQQQRMNSKLAQLQSDETRAQRVVLLLAVGATLSGLILAWAMTRSIVQPVGEAVAVAEAIAHGDLTKTVPVGKEDEVGQLLHALRAMRDSIASREEKILRLAYEDSLTGLASRNRFIQTFSELPAHCCGAVVVLDIDRFSLINNALGHDVGDRLLQEMANRLGWRPASLRAQQMPNLLPNHLPDGQLVARLWGNQFAFLLPGAKEDAATDFAHGIVELLHTPMDVDGQRLDVGGTMGIALYPQDGKAPELLLRRAELAMRAAKRRRTPFAFVASGIEEAPHEQLSLIGEMREALARREFVAYYQPKLDLQRNVVTGAEALLRWQHPEKGLIPPGRFIPFAEQTGFIRDITPWLLELVIGQAAQWRRDGLDIIPSVNLSTYDLLNPQLVADIRRLLGEQGLAPEQLCLEITESALMEEPALALKHLNELSELGLKLSIDDYGSGQASLAYLQTLPVDELKIDRTFITDVPSSRKNGAIVRSTILLCHDLGLSVVAEGAEESAEIDWLRAAGCDTVQGYGVAKPMPLEQFVAWVRQYPAPSHSG